MTTHKPGKSNCRLLALLVVLTTLSCPSSFASTSRVQQADSLISTDGTKSFSLPAATDTLVGRASIDTLSNKTFSDAITGAQIVTPANPVASHDKLYFKSDDSLYSLSSAGVETKISGGSSGTWVQEFPSGTCNGVTTSFTLSYTPTASAVVSAYLDKAIMYQGAGLDYTMSGTTLTLVTACASGQTVYVKYAH